MSRLQRVRGHAASSRQPDPPGAARQVQEVGPRLDLVAAQPARDRRSSTRSSSAYFLKIDPPTGHPSGLHSLRAVPAVRARAVELLFQNGLDMGLGSLVGNAQPHQEGVLPPRAARRRRATASLVRHHAHRAGRARRDPPAGRQHGPAVDPGGAAAHRDRRPCSCFGMRAWCSRCATSTSATCSTWSRSSCQVLFYSAPIVYPIRLVPVHATVLGVEIPLLRISTSSTRWCASSERFRACSTTCASRRSGTSRTSSLWAIGTLLVGLLGVRQARPPPRRGGLTVGTAIVVDDVWKKFRLYHERNQSLKAAVMRGRRARYKEFEALEDVSFEVAQGTTFGLIGENGSGKSTLLKCIARILRPERGAITSTRQDLRAARARRRLPPRAVGARERLPQRRDPRPVEEAARRALRRHRRLRRPRASSSTPR